MANLSKTLGRNISVREDDYVIQYGKHKGRTRGWVKIFDRDFIKWYVKNVYHNNKGCLFIDEDLY